MVSTDDTVPSEVLDNSEDAIQKLKEENRLNSDCVEEAPSTSNDGMDIENGAPLPENSENGTSAPEKTKPENGSTENGSTERKRKDSEDVIELDDDEEEAAPPAKKHKTDTEQEKEQPSPVPEDPTIKKEEKEKEKKEKEPELTNSEALLNKLEEYVNDAIEKGTNVQRKILDALLGAINVQVQREPLSVRKLILDKQLVLPNTISFPPSMVVDMVIEHDPEFPLSKVVTKMFGEERPKLSENEKKERALFKQQFPAPHMTKLLMDIGQDLVQEATYSDIVHARNLPETPKNLDTYKQVAAQLKPVWEALKKKNEPYKMKYLSCQVCGFRTESRIVLQNHRSMMHNDGRKFQCAMCPEIDTNEHRMMTHYLENHQVIATKEEPVLRNPCLICDEDFQYKGQRDTHMRQVCKRDFARIRYIMAPKGKEDSSAINVWLWEKPPVDPTILAQQQSQREQQLKQQRAQQAAAVLAAQQRRQQPQTPNAAALQAALLQQQQQLLTQQRLRQAQQLQQQQRNNPNLGGMPSLMGNQNLIAAMQQHLARAAQSTGARGASATNLTANMARLYQNQLASAQAQKAAAAAIVKNAKNPNTNLAVAMQMLTQQSARSSSNTSTSGTGSSSATTGGVANQQTCEICDQNVQDRDRYLTHLQLFHKQMKGKSVTDMQQGAPLACSRCKERFWTYEGLERHLVMSHGLVTSDLLQKAQKKEDGGRCKLCGKQYAFNMLQHLVADHQVKLCSAEIMYSCDVCSFKCSSYQKLEHHLNTVHPKNGDESQRTSGTNSPLPVVNGGASKANEAEVVTLDD